MCDILLSKGEGERAFLWLCVPSPFSVEGHCVPSRYPILATKLALIYTEVECSQTNGGASIIGSQHVSVCILLKPWKRCIMGLIF